MSHNPELRDADGSGRLISGASMDAEEAFNLFKLSNIVSPRQSFTTCRVTTLAQIAQVAQAGQVKAVRCECKNTPNICPICLAVEGLTPEATALIALMVKKED